MLALVPLNLNGHPLKWQSGKRQQIMSRPAADFIGWETDNAKFELAFDLLVKALRTADAGREAPPIPSFKASRASACGGVLPDNSAYPADR